MNGKLQKFYKNLFNFSAGDYLSNPQSIAPFIKQCAEFDFVIAGDIWEYLILEHERLLDRDMDFAAILGETVFNALVDKYEIKLYKLVNDNPNIRKAVYTTNPNACENATFEMLIALLITNKLKEAEEIFRALQKNNNCRAFGQLMKDIVERILVELIKKANAQGKKIEMPKKLGTLLLAYIAKIKGPEKLLLVQRIKEIN